MQISSLRATFWFHQTSLIITLSNCIVIEITILYKHINFHLIGTPGKHNLWNLITDSWSELRMILKFHCDNVPIFLQVFCTVTVLLLGTHIVVLLVILQVKNSVSIIFVLIIIKSLKCTRFLIKSTCNTRHGKTFEYNRRIF